MKYIKNNSGSDKTWLGQLLVNQEYYEILYNEERLFANNSSVLTAIATGNALMAIDNTGNQDITDIAKSINFLKDNITESVSVTALKDSKNKRARLVGTHSITAIADSSTTVDWIIPQLQYPSGTDVPMVFNGIQYYAEDSTMGDYLEFMIADTNGAGVGLGLYDQETLDSIKDANGHYIIEQFGKKWFLAQNSLEDIILYPAKLLPGLSIRVIYHNTHEINDIKFFCNIYRHLETQ